ncbi:MAG TPA: AMP-binding protein [Desulfomonilaceae bacterium]|nr:AMP-binding protein [Desulfomonilaceae bacterium]
MRSRILPEDSEANVKSAPKEYRDFSWDSIERQFTWHETGAINIAHESLDRWAADENKREQTALVFEKAGKVTEFTYIQLREITSQWANLLIEEGFTEGDRVFIFLPACPEIYFAMLACARLGIIFSPMRSDLGFGEQEFRLQNAKPRGIVTRPDMLDMLPRHAMGSVERVFLVEGPKSDCYPNEVIIPELLDEFPKRNAVRWVRATAPLFLIYVSGATGPPKGIVHAHMSMLGHLMTGKHVLGLDERSVVWTDGDPGSVTSTVYALFAPLLCGSTTVIQGDRFAASTWYRTLEKRRVSVLYTTPRTIERLMEAGNDLARRYNFPHLTRIATAGETLTPEQFFWTKKVLRLAPQDTWWMTEAGMICIANVPSMTTKPGSMGKTVPGIEATVLDENGEPSPVLTMGELALKAGWPSMMTGIWQDAPRYQEYFRFREWFLTGDMVTRDEDGYFFHQGRNDDLIKFGDTLVGPYEIEHILAMHPAVTEAVVIAVKPVAGRHTLKAFATLNDNFTASARLNHEIRMFVRAHFSPEIPLASLIFLDEFPKTSSGKLLRRVLRARELGLPSGDPLKLKE